MERLDEPPFFELNHTHEGYCAEDLFERDEDQSRRGEIKPHPCINYAPYSLSDRGRENNLSLSSYSQSISKDDLSPSRRCMHSFTKDYSPLHSSFCPVEHREVNERWGARELLYPSPPPVSSLNLRDLFPTSRSNDELDIHERDGCFGGSSSRYPQDRLGPLDHCMPLSSRSPPYNPATCQAMRKLGGDTHFFVFEVQFKRSSRLCVGSEDDSCVDIGDYVCVTGDRGVDLGKVINRKLCYHLPPQSLPIVLNKANYNEIHLLKDQRREEYQVVNLCREKASTHGLSMVILDAEFQYDRKKLTIYYYSDVRIDFRGFVKELYSLFYARIWMENVKLSCQSTASS